MGKHHKAKKKERKARDAEIPEALVSFDFRRFFPHKFWISNWSKDEEYPAGFRYKLLSVRDEEKDEIQLVTVMEEPGGIKTERDRTTYSPPSAFERILPKYVASLEETFSIKFDLIDVSDIRTAEEYELEGFLEWDHRPPN